MNLANISTTNQVIMPVEIRRAASSQAIYKAQQAFADVAGQMGVYKEEDVQALVDEVRKNTSPSYSTTRTT